MTSYDPYPEKLPSISTLNQQQQQQQQQENDIATYSQDMPFSNFVPNADMYANSTASNTNNDMQLDLYNLHHLSPPLTPAVSPSNMMDPMQFKRKYSVDVGPFGFNAHPSLMHDEDAYRRSSCSAMSVDDCLQHHNDPLQHQYQHQEMIQYQTDYQHDYAYFNDGSSPMSDDIETATTTDMDSGIKSNKPKSGQHYQQGPNAPHKHVCKYSYCGWSFKRYEHLKRHMLVHTGERPHMCAFPGCGKSFSRSDNFHAHYRTHIKKQSVSSPDGQNHSARRGSKKSGPRIGANINLPVAASPSSSTSSISSQQDLIQGFAASQPFVFNEKSFDVSYHDMYDQSPFANDVQNQYSSLTSPQSYMRMDMAHHDGTTSLLNHDQASSPMFPSNVFPPAYDLQCDYTSFQSTVGMLPPPSPTSTLIDTGSSNVTSSSNKKQRKYKSTLLHCNNNSNSLADGGQQKSHVCSITQCQRRFKRLEHLKRHMRIHTLERPFACTYPKCHKHFSRSDNLSQHMKTHQHRPGQDKRRNSSATTSSSSSSSNSSVSPRSVMDDFNSTSTMVNHHPSSADTFSTSDPFSSLPSCWTSSESVGC